MSLHQAGQILKKKRLENRWNLKMVSEISRIRVEKLQAIENGDETSFSAKVHARGFIKIYAKVLSLNPAPLLEMYKAEEKVSDYPVVSISIEKLNKNVRSLFTISNMATSLTMVSLVAVIMWTVLTIQAHKSTLSDVSLSQLQSATSFQVNQESGSLIPLLHAQLPDRFPLFDSLSSSLLSANHTIWTEIPKISASHRMQRKVAHFKPSSQNNSLLKTKQQTEKNDSHSVIEKLKLTFLSWFKK